ncbi:MAG: hypothetical protein MUF54_14050 [Polyangiaceae bacterium]|nr:hypothetical protein [Polyangiaceae bacterium]
MSLAFWDPPTRVQATWRLVVFLCLGPITGKCFSSVRGPISTAYLEPYDLRRWDDALIESGLAYEDQSAFALGQDIARIAGPAHLTVIDAFVAAASDEASSNNAVFARGFGASGDTAVVATRLQSFRMGLRSAG